MQAVFDFSQIRISVASDFDFAVSPKLEQFRSSGGEADVKIIASLSNELPEKRPYELQIDGGKRYLKIAEFLRDSIDADTMLRESDIYQMLLCGNAVVLHASYVLYRGAAIAFCAPSCTGKSTQAALWERFRSAVTVNGDRTLVRKTHSGFVAGGIYFCGSSDICKNITAPLRAVVLLGQAKENRLCKVSGRKAFTGVFRQTAYNKSPEAAADIVSQLVNEVDIYSFDCLPDESAVDLLCGELF